MKQYTIFFTENNNNSYFHCLSYERYQLQKNIKGVKHMHAFSEIFFVTNGKGFFYFKDQKIPISRGMVIFANGNVSHSESSHPDDILEYAVLSVSNHVFFPNHSQGHSDVLFHDFTDKYDILYEFIQKIEYEYSIKEPFWQNALQIQFNSYILFLLRTGNLFVLPTTTRYNKPNPLEQVHLYLTANFDENITLDKLADIFCINKYYLAHSFKDIYGDSIINTLNKIRCKEARQMLKNSDYSVNEIAISTGFNSCSYFSKVYRQIYGESPLQTRNALTTNQG